MSGIPNPPFGGNTQDNLLRFPDRASVAIRIIRDDAAWLVIASSHGWLHGDRQSALEDAAWLAANLGLRVEAAA